MMYVDLERIEKNIEENKAFMERMAKEIAELDEWLENEIDIDLDEDLII
jgi:archaellum component FlaC